MWAFTPRKLRKSFLILLFISCWKTPYPKDYNFLIDNSVLFSTHFLQTLPKTVQEIPQIIAFFAEIISGKLVNSIWWGARRILSINIYAKRYCFYPCLKKTQHRQNARIDIFTNCFWFQWVTGSNFTSLCLSRFSRRNITAIDDWINSSQVLTHIKWK